MSLRWLAVGALTALLVPASALARDAAPSELEWLCWLETHTEFYVRCRLDEDPLAQVIDGDAFVSASIGPPVDHRAVRQEIFKPGHAPNVARLVRDDPARFASLVWSIPLYGLPFDDSPVRELAQSVMCGSDRRCIVHFGTPQMPAIPSRIARR